MWVYVPVTECVKTVAAHGHRLPEPCMDCVRFADHGRDWSEDEAHPTVHIVLGGCTTGDQVSSIHALSFAGAFGRVQENTLRETATLLRRCSCMQRNASNRKKGGVSMFIDGTMKCIREVPGIDDGVHTNNSQTSRHCFFPGRDPALLPRFL